MNFTFTIVTGLVAAAFAFFILGFSHWAAERAAGHRLGRITSYTIGITLIGIILTGWCIVQPTPIPAWWVAAEFWLIAVFAGLGTASAYDLDNRAGKETELKLRRKHMGDE